MRTQPINCVTSSVLTLVIALAAAPCLTAKAELLYGASCQLNQLVSFDSAAPGTLLSANNISGLQAGEQLRGIDWEGGTLYGLGDGSHLYTINTNTAAATLVASFSPVLNGIDFGFSGGYVSSDLGQNLRINLLTGAATGGPNYTSGSSIDAMAYEYVTHSFYGISAGSHNFSSLNPVTGMVTLIGPAGVAFQDRVGLSISPSTGTVFFSGTASGQTSFYTLNRSTGALTLVGAVGVPGELTSGLDSISVIEDTPLAPPCTPAPSGLVSWWPGESTANDIIGTNNGTLMNGATFAPGEVGAAFSLDGLSAYVAVPDAATLNPAGDFSIEAWIKTSGTADYSGIVNKYEGFTNFPELIKAGYFLGLKTGGILWCGLADGVGNTTWASNSKTVTDAQWHHAVAVFHPDAFSSQVGVYVDGVASDGLSDLNGYSPSTHPLFIGNGNTDFYSAGFFNGLIDEVSFYNRALSLSEVHALYSAGSSGKCLAPPQISNLKRSGSSVDLTWVAQKGMQYRAQYKTDLNEVIWHDLDGYVTASNGTASITDTTVGDAPQRFYRVQLLP